MSKNGVNRNFWDPEYFHINGWVIQFSWWQLNISNLMAGLCCKLETGICNSVIETWLGGQTIFFNLNCTRATFSIWSWWGFGGGSGEFIPVAAAGAGRCGSAGNGNFFKSLTIWLRGASALCPYGFRSLVEFLLIGIRFSGTSSAWLSRNVGRVLVARPYVSAHHVLGGMPPRSSPFLVFARSPHQIVLSFSPPNLCQTSRLSCFLLHL